MEEPLNLYLCCKLCALKSTPLLALFDTRRNCIVTGETADEGEKDPVLINGIRPLDGNYLKCGNKN